MKMDEDEDPTCMPVEIYPKGISLNDYDIRYDGDRIKEVRNKQLGLIKYKSQKIDGDCGYVVGSKVVVFTHTFAADILNIVHMHVNDMSETVTVETACMMEGNTIKDFDQFSTDYTG